jgi:hypothetical protein
MRAKVTTSTCAEQAREGPLRTRHYGIFPDTAVSPERAEATEPRPTAESY